MKKLILAALFCVALTSRAWSDPVTEALFAEGIFDDLPDGQEIGYRHSRSGDPSADFQPVTEGRIVIVPGQAEDGTRNLTLTVEADGRQPKIADFPASGGNPVLMVFLESAVRSMASISGGSPHYIRNRIKDALRQGGDLADVPHAFEGRTLAARSVTLHPFANDPNRDRMGAFAELTLHFVVSDAVPGHFLQLTADTPDAATGYHEAITLTQPGGEGQ